MQSFNILFSFRDSAHIAHVQYTSFTQSYIIYFTDVELILEFGSRAELNSSGVFSVVKDKKASEVYLLGEAISQHLTNAA